MREKQELVAELCHEINSPLAAIRNALFLVASRSDDPEIRNYLALADHEVTIIADTLRRARALCESCEPVATPPLKIVSRRAAA